MKKYRAVFISPHLDDAIFSCGGTIAELCRQGPVLIINVFTRFPEDVKTLTLSLSEDRHQEEARATELLGCSSISLDETDAFLRQPEYRSFRRLFGPPVPADVADLPRLTARIAKALALAGAEGATLYAPLGVGWHVDHILCHEVVHGLGLKQNLVYYEDAPYCLVPNAVRARLDEVGRASGVPERKPFRRECRDISRQILNGAMIRNIRPRPLQWVAKPVMGMGLFELLWRHRAGAVPNTSIPLPALQAHWRDISVDYALKLEAMRRYESQFPAFFQGPAECETLHRRHAREMGGKEGLYELFWSAA